MSLNFLQEQIFKQRPEFDYLFSNPSYDDDETILQRLPTEIANIILNEKKVQLEINEEVKKMKKRKN
jgi:hypothetical protein